MPLLSSLFQAPSSISLKILLGTAVPPPPWRIYREPSPSASSAATPKTASPSTTSTSPTTSLTESTSPIASKRRRTSLRGTLRMDIERSGCHRSLLSRSLFRFRSGSLDYTIVVVFSGSVENMWEVIKEMLPFKRWLKTAQGNDNMADQNTCS